MINRVESFLTIASHRLTAPERMVRSSGTSPWIDDVRVFVFADVNDPNPHAFLLVALGGG